MKKIYIFLVFTLLLITSCGRQKSIGYFQDIEKYTNGVIDTASVDYSAEIRSDDELSIIVSSIDPAAVASFNLQIPTMYRYRSMAALPETPDGREQSYLVDKEGCVNFPTLGRLKLAGMTTEQAVVYLQEALKEYVKDPIVNLKILNFKVSILGEVAMPGTHYFSGQRVSILDALASAKDITIYGRRNNVLLIRDNFGKKEYMRFDLTKSDLLTSSNFYLQQNDVLYIEPNKQKQQEAGVIQQRQFNLTIITSTVGTAVSVLTAYLAIKNL